MSTNPSYPHILPSPSLVSPSTTAAIPYGFPTASGSFYPTQLHSAAPPISSAVSATSSSFTSPPNHMPIGIPIGIAPSFIQHQPHPVVYIPQVQDASRPPASSSARPLALHPRNLCSTFSPSLTSSFNPYHSRKKRRLDAQLQPKFSIHDDISRIRGLMKKLEEKLDLLEKSTLHKLESPDVSVSDSIGRLDNSDWDQYDPDFLSNDYHQDMLKLLNEDLLLESVWNPFSLIPETTAETISEIVDSAQSTSVPIRNHHVSASPLANIKFEEIQQLNSQSPEFSSKDLARLQHSLHLLRLVGIKNHSPKVHLYAQIVLHKGIIKLCNQEFLDLVGGSSIEVVGRSMHDFIPRAFNQYFSYYFHRELIASGSSSVLFENILARLDGTVFRCYNTLHVLRDANDLLCESVLAIHLNTIQPLDIPPCGYLPRTKPIVSLEMRYPDSPKLSSASLSNSTDILANTTT